MNTSIFLALFGVALLVQGYRLFWLFVAGVGFVVGLQAAAWIAGPQPFWVLWGVGLFCGIAGALLAWFFQHLTIAVGGFVAGSGIVLYLMQQLDINGWGLLAILGGIAGALALMMLFDWALVVLSSAVGAGFIVEAAGWQSPSVSIGYLGLAAAGIILQGLLMAASRRRRG